MTPAPSPPRPLTPALHPQHPQAQIVGVSDVKSMYTARGKQAWGSAEASRWSTDQGALAGTFRSRYGLEVRCPLPAARCLPLSARRCRSQLAPRLPPRHCWPTSRSPAHPLACSPASPPPARQVGHVDIILHVRTCEGFVRNPDGTIVKKWSKEEEMYPMQVGGRV